jgi:polyhydroxyalkanoate synthesis regulator phasin
MKDRNYFRAIGNKSLLEQARESDNELAIALGERLEDTLEDIETADREEIEDLKRVIEELRAELAEAEETINELLENVK